MGLIPGDIVTDLDLLALDSQALDDFGATSQKLVEKRRVAVSDWLKPRLEQRNLPVDRHSIRRAPDAAWSVTGGAWTDQRAEFGQTAETPVSSMLVGVTDYLYLGMRDPFRGVFVGMTDNVNVNSLKLQGSYWNGQWQSFDATNSFVDGTRNAQVSFARGGRVLWALPDDWFARDVHGSMAYWARFSVNSVPLTSTTAVGQLLPLSRSRLTDPVAHYALHLIYREAITGRNDYAVKAKWYFDAAMNALDTAMLFIDDEFDIDQSQAVERTEVNSITPNAWAWERG
jgi:hypothetical protein